MTNFIFTELNKTNKKTAKKSIKPSSNNYSFNLITNKSFSNNFMTAINYEDLDDSKNITNKFISGQYELKSKYTLLYLYDIGNIENQNFIINYGAQLHNISSANFTILTYFSPDICCDWKNVQNREMIECGDVSPEDCIEITNELKQLYNVMGEAAIVVIKYDKQTKQEEHFNVDVSNKSDSELFNTFLIIMNIINSNCDDSFDQIKERVMEPISNTMISNNFESFKTQRIIDSYTKKYDIEIQEIADKLCISDSSFRHRKKDNNLTRNECISLGVIFKLSIDKINKLLRSNTTGGNNYRDLEYDGRDGIIRECLAKLNDINLTNIDYVNEELIRNNYLPLIDEDTKNKYQSNKKLKEKNENDCLDAKAKELLAKIGHPRD